MLDAMRSAHTLMAQGAHGYYVVGNNSTVVAGEKIEIPLTISYLKSGCSRMVPMRTHFNGTISIQRHF